MPVPRRRPLRRTFAAAPLLLLPWIRGASHAAAGAALAGAAGGERRPGAYATDGPRPRGRGLRDGDEGTSLGLGRSSLGRTRRRTQPGRQRSPIREPDVGEGAGTGTGNDPADAGGTTADGAANAAATGGYGGYANGSGGYASNTAGTAAADTTTNAGGYGSLGGSSTGGYGSSGGYGSGSYGSGSGSYGGSTYGGGGSTSTYGGGGSSYGSGGGTYGSTYGGGSYSSTWGAASSPSSSSSLKKNFHAQSLPILPAVVLLLFVSLFGMLTTAYQMEHNPEGTYANCCRVSLHTVNCIYKVIYNLYHCRLGDIPQVVFASELEEDEYTDEEIERMRLRPGIERALDVEHRKALRKAGIEMGKIRAPPPTKNGGAPRAGGARR